MYRLRSRHLAYCLFLLLAAAAWPAQAQQVDAAALAGMQARSIGPAGMSGRVSAIDVVIDNPDIIYVGAATGGLWKSVDAATTWKPIFDDQPVAAIGAVSIFQPSPDIVWVGTGEGNPRNSVSVGNGVYKSIDGGRTWTHLGLDGSERINRILLHPTNPDIAYVAALGQAWGENEERGVFKTVDGGDSWTKVLYVNERTGASELAMDPGNPDKLFATTWEFRRWPFFFKSGGEGSGIWRTYDGGDNWTRLTEDDGLPKGELGRIGIAIAPSAPDIVYALVEAKDSALIRSDDGGHVWRTVNDDTDVSPRPFYFSGLRVDSARPDRLYRVASSVSVSNDGGRTFSGLSRGFTTHPDHHAFWIHPDDPTFIVDGNDGGISITRDRGLTWNFVRNLPLAQYYHVAVDMAVPYNIYGGLQDNGSWRGPSSVWAGGFFGGGIRNFDWEMVAFGDGFDTRAIDAEGQSGYAMSQGGNLVQWNLGNGEARGIRPDGPDEEELRFNWSAGLAVDPFDQDVVYYGSQFLHKSVDRGATWTRISEDLTSDEPEWQQQAESGGLTVDVTAAENYTTIIAIAPSPLQRDLLWVGTDDGRLHVTRDGGVTWSSVEGNVPDVPRNTWIPHIEPSRHDPGSAFVVFDDHRRSNWTPYVFRTTDYGETWQSIASDNLWGYALTIVQDYENPDLLFLGTEFGLWVSFDGGGAWSKWTNGVPTVSVMDLVIHPREHDLVIGTHGRALYVLDDIRPLREVAEGALEQPLRLFPIPDAQQFGSFAARGELMPGSAEFVGENRAYGAMISYSLNDEDLPERDADSTSGAPGGFGGFGGGESAAAPRGPQVSIEILDAEGTKVRTVRAAAHRGLNRTMWNLRRDGFRRAPGGGGGFFGSRGGPEMPAGTYTVKVTYKEQSAERTVTVNADPRTLYSDAERDAKWQAILAMGAVQELGADALGRIGDTRRDVDAVLAKANGSGRPGGDGRPGAGGREGRGGGQRPGAPDAAAAGSGDEQAAGEDQAETTPRQQLAEAGKELKTALDATEQLFRVLPGTKGIPKRQGAMNKVSSALGRLQSTWGAPGASDNEFIRQGREAMDAAVAALNELMAGKVAEFRQLMGEADIQLLPETEPLALPESR